MNLRQIVDKITREKVLILGAVTAVIGFLALVGVNVDPKVLAGAMTAAGALFALVRAFVTPTVEVVAQQKPGEAVKATARAEQSWGLKAGSIVHVTEAVKHRAA